MASIRAIYILNTDNKILFSRKFPTIENRLKKKMGSEYISIPSNDKTVSNAFYKKVIREELLQEEFKCMTYKQELEINHQKMDQLVEAVDINLNSSNFLNYSECPIVSLEIGSGEILWPCIYIKKFKIYGVALPNIDHEKFKLIKSQVENEKEKFSENENFKIQENEGNSKNSSEKFSPKNSSENPSTPSDKNSFFGKNFTYSNKDPQIIDRIKKLYEEQDLSIVGSFILVENLLNYIISSKHYEENKLHTLISNMIPFGNITETNINFMLESLNFLNTRTFTSSNTIFSNLIDGGKKSGLSNESQDKIKIPGWVTKIPSKAKECLNITIKEELKFVKYDNHNKSFNLIMCDISCLADLSRNCEITLPLKENHKTNYLSNLRIHPCAKIENQNILNDATRIIFIPPHDEFKMGVFEIENIEQNKLPIIANFSLKEANQNEVKIYLIVEIEQNAVGKFDYFYINIPLGHFGTIIDTKIMVQVGEVSLINNKTTLHWNLQNKVFDKQIILSGSVNYIKNDKKKNLTNTGNFSNYNLNHFSTTNRDSAASTSSSNMNIITGNLNNQNNLGTSQTTTIHGQSSHSHLNANSVEKNNITANVISNINSTNHPNNYQISNNSTSLQSQNNVSIIGNNNPSHNRKISNSHINGNNNQNEFEILDSNKIFEELKVTKKIPSSYNFSFTHSDFNEKSIYLDEMIRNKSHVGPTSDIISTNCFCKIHFRLHNYSLSDLEIDKKSLLFYPKLSPKIDLRRQFVSNDYVVWNNMSFNNYEINIPEKPNISLLNINIEENSNPSINGNNVNCGGI